MAKLFAQTSSVILPLWTREQLPIMTREKGYYFIETIGLFGNAAIPVIIHMVSYLFLNFESYRQKRMKFCFML